MQLNTPSIPCGKIIFSLVDAEVFYLFVWKNILRNVLRQFFNFKNRAERTFSAGAGNEEREIEDILIPPKRRHTWNSTDFSDKLPFFGTRKSSSARNLFDVCEEFEDDTLKFDFCFRLFSRDTFWSLEKRFIC